MGAPPCRSTTGLVMADRRRDVTPAALIDLRPPAVQVADCRCWRCQDAELAMAIVRTSRRLRTGRKPWPDDARRVRDWIGWIGDREAV